jgi:hypothetical protein
VLFGLLVLAMGVKSPLALVPALTLLFTSQVAAYPFNVADKAGLETLYGVLPLPRRSVLYGHYAWAIAVFLTTAAVGTALALLLARVQAMPFGGRILAILTLSWALFAVNVAIQFPLLIRFGYTRISALSTTLPLTLVVFESVQPWLPLAWAAGVAAIVTSAAVAMTADRRRVRYSRPHHDDRTSGTSIRCDDHG